MENLKNESSKNDDVEELVSVHPNDLTNEQIKIIGDFYANGEEDGIFVDALLSKFEDYKVFSRAVSVLGIGHQMIEKIKEKHSSSGQDYQRAA